MNIRFFIFIINLTLLLLRNRRLLITLYFQMKKQANPSSLLENIRNLYSSIKDINFQYYILWEIKLKELATSQDEKKEELQQNQGKDLIQSVFSQKNLSIDRPNKQIKLQSSKFFNHLLMKCLNRNCIFSNTDKNNFKIKSCLRQMYPVRKKKPQLSNLWIKKEKRTLKEINKNYISTPNLEKTYQKVPRKINFNVRSAISNKKKNLKNITTSIFKEILKEKNQTITTKNTLPSTSMKMSKSKIKIENLVQQKQIQDHLQNKLPKQVGQFDDFPHIQYFQDFSQRIIQEEQFSNQSKRQQRLREIIKFSQQLSPSLYNIISKSILQSNQIQEIKKKQQKCDYYTNTHRLKSSLSSQSLKNQNHSYLPFRKLKNNIYRNKNQQCISNLQKIRTNMTLKQQKVQVNEKERQYDDQNLIIIKSYKKIGRNSLVININSKKTKFQKTFFRNS